MYTVIHYNKDADKVLRKDELQELARYIAKEGAKGNFNITIYAKPRGDNHLQIIADYLNEGNKPTPEAVAALVGGAS